MKKKADRIFLSVGAGFFYCLARKLTMDFFLVIQKKIRWRQGQTKKKFRPHRKKIFAPQQKKTPRIFAKSQTHFKVFSNFFRTVALACHLINNGAFSDIILVFFSQKNRLKLNFQPRFTLISSLFLTIRGFKKNKAFATPEPHHNKQQQRRGCQSIISSPNTKQTLNKENDLEKEYNTKKKHNPKIVKKTATKKKAGNMPADNV